MELKESLRPLKGKKVRVVKPTPTLPLPKGTVLKVVTNFGTQSFVLETEEGKKYVAPYLAIRVEEL